MENLSTKSLKLSLESLKISIEKFNKDNSDEFVRDSVIQRFEYTYALAVKYIQKYLEMTSANPDEVDHYTFNELIREANEKGIIFSDIADWTVYRQRRNITSHTYNLDKALQVIDIIPNFIRDIDFLLEKIS